MNRKYLFAWANLDWLTENRYKKLLQIYPNLETAWNNICRRDLIKMGESTEKIDKFFEKKETSNPEREQEKLEEIKGTLIFIEDELYPKALKEIHQAPMFLYCLGNIENIDNSLAIVGSRKVSTYGVNVTEQLTKELSKNLIIVSGFAYGVDVIAHKACVDTSRRTIAVIGSGIDNPYPAGNSLYINKILENNGAIISEFPLGTVPNNYNFPRRNRIISGITRGTLVIEAERKSGSLITAKYALEQNKEVFAVPGNLYSGKSEGTNLLIQKGMAKLVTKAEDVLEELSITNQTEEKVISFSSEEEKLIYRSLSEGTCDAGKLSKDTCLPIPKVSSTLTMMEIKGIIKNIGSGVWSQNC